MSISVVLIVPTATITRRYFRQHIDIFAEKNARSSLVVTIQKAAQGPQDRALPFIPSALGCRLEHAAGQPGKWERLEPDFSRACQLCEEKAFTTKQRGFDTTGPLEIKLYTGFHGHDATGIDMQDLAGLQGTTGHGTAGMHEHETIALELLQNKSFPAKESRQDLSLKMDSHGNPFGSA